MSSSPGISTDKTELVLLGIGRRDWGDLSARRRQLPRPPKRDELSNAFAQGLPGDVDQRDLES